jgi:hypothetical protein
MFREGEPSQPLRVTIKAPASSLGSLILGPYIAGSFPVREPVRTPPNGGWGVDSSQPGTSSRFECGPSNPV